MKKCPTCNRTFTDDALSFCLEDGSPLLSVGSESGPPSYDPGATIQYNPGRETNPPPPSSYTPSQTPGYQAPPPAWSPMPPPGSVPGGGMPGGPPKKKSKGIYWVIGIIAVVVVLGIGGIILAVVLVGMSASNTNNGNTNNSNSTANSNSNAKNSNNANNSNSDNSNSNANTSSPKDYVAQDDFSTTKWWVGSNTYGKAEYVNGEYQLSGMGGYVAVYGLKTYGTKDATTRVTTRSVTGVSPENGYGLTIYSELRNGQLEDYSFVIRTDDSAAFCVYLHKAGKETSLVSWTEATQIRRGSSTNQLEVRATESQISFYINGTFATSITDTAGYKTGVAGLYTSGTVPIAFDDLEIFR